MVQEPKSAQYHYSKGPCFRTDFQSRCYRLEYKESGPIAGIYEDMSNQQRRMLLFGQKYKSTSLAFNRFLDELQRIDEQESTENADTRNTQSRRESFDF